MRKDSRIEAGVLTFGTCPPPQKLAGLETLEIRVSLIQAEHVRQTGTWGNQSEEAMKCWEALPVEVRMEYIRRFKLLALPPRFTCHRTLWGIVRI